MMQTLVTLEIKGDGKRRLEELLAAAIEKLAHDSSVREAFLRHPLLQSVPPSALLGKISRKRAARVIEAGLLSSDDGRELIGDALFGRGREIETTIPLALLLGELGLMPPSLSPGLPPVQILFENEDCLAVYKPHDLPSAPLRSDETDSAVHRTLAYFAKLPILRDNPLEPGLMHRLDTGTSGALLFVKSAEAFTRIGKIWNSGQVKKDYRARVALEPGAPRLTTGRIELLLGHDAKSKRKMRVIRGPQDAKLIRGDAQRALSEILRVNPLAQESLDVSIRIETGVHHQIRATLSHLGAPLLGDSIYGGREEARLWLHAWKILIPTGAGKSLEIVAPLPADWPTG
ncbi:MAG: RluA family pseudouridine synthase [Cryobacterium sp.]|nr:RluA family pseudouridine synthase [Oligoflexia bacterium]